MEIIKSKQMDIPDHLLEEFDFAADCITSCDKVHKSGGVLNEYNKQAMDISYIQG